MKIVLSLWLVILLAGCAPTLTPAPSPAGESPTPAATWTPVPTATATATPMPQLTREDLKSMSVDDKLKMAPQPGSAPEDVVSSFAAGESARDIAWSGKSLTFWERVVAYEGTTRSGEKVTLYYDLESGQWAKQYADFDEVSKIPADEVADVMVISGQLVKNKPAFGEGWHDQTEKTPDGKMVFRDENGYVLAVFDVNNNEWITPNQADVESPTEVSDLRPAYVEKVSQKFMGAQIDASLITDSSFERGAHKVTVGEQAYAEFMARSIYGVWANYHPGETLETYMQMIAEVQRGERDPLDIAFPVYANDARDGIPYRNKDRSFNPNSQKKYLVVPWYTGELPNNVDGAEVRGIREFNIVYVDGKMVKNITLFVDHVEGQGNGLSVDNNRLYYYIDTRWLNLMSGKVNSLASATTGLKWWTLKEDHSEVDAIRSEAKEDFLYKLLKNGGFTITPPLQ
ncbi:MAG: hypothetical protein QY329_03130 [Anaerolineales bacterium]|nr:MAG: hypothetical protein QY329_03130 [Anaerolineales bacterium]